MKQDPGVCNILVFRARIYETFRNILGVLLTLHLVEG